MKNLIFYSSPNGPTLFSTLPRGKIPEPTADAFGHAMTTACQL